MAKKQISESKSELDELVKALADRAIITMNLAEGRRAFDRAMIEAAWNMNSGKTLRTAEMLGISRKSLWELRRRLGLAH